MKNRMRAGSAEDGKWSDNKMEGDDGLSTVQCLRGRLLAERQASRVAKENAKLLETKLIELENQLKEEIKMRNIAEKKLKLMMKKIESLNISTMSVDSEQSSSSEKCEMSRRSSTSTSGSKDVEEDEPKSQFTSTVVSQKLEHNVSETSTVPQGFPTPTVETDFDLNNPSQESFRYKLIPSPEDPKANNHSCSSLKSSITDDGSDSGDNVDNLLAIVPVTFPAASETGDQVKPLNQTVDEVLDALRQVREKLQGSMQRRHTIQVGPTKTYESK